MAGKRAFAFFLHWLLLLCLSSTALAHRLNVFAYVEGDIIHVEARFQRAEPARISSVEVRNAVSGRVYLTGETDAEGRFSFAIPAPARRDRAKLDILVRAGEGHQNHWMLAAAEYLPPLPAASAPTRRQPTVQAEVKSTPQPQAVAPACPPPADLTPLVESAVERKIAPLRQMLLDSQEPGLREIVGGIGYLVGIAGLLAYVRAGRGRRDER